MRWPWGNTQPLETRQESLSSIITTALLKHATGAAGDASSLSCCRAAAKLVARAVSAATVAPTSPATAGRNASLSSVGSLSAGAAGPRR